MQIKQISVTGLFGIFDHVIPLNMNDRITIVHGPNGFGKTAMLRLLNGFFNSDYSIFQAIPFDDFSIVFNDEAYFQVTKKHVESEVEKEEIIINYYALGGDRISSSLRKSMGSSKTEIPISVLDGISDIRQITPNKWMQVSTGEIISLEEVISRFEDRIPPKMLLQNESRWLMAAKRGIVIRLIESQRLLNFGSTYSSRIVIDPNSPSLTVSTYYEELNQIVRDKFSEYGAISQSLDRTFPSRLLQRQSAPNLTDEELRERLYQLQLAQSRLIEIGLLDQSENSDFPVQPPTMDESTKNILSVYVEDIEKKLSVFDNVASKIELLTNTINSKFVHSYKKMSFSKDQGFIFRTLHHYHSSMSDSDTISLSDLSSGEQHLLVLLYELLFKVEPKSLVLIDEPELSLHVGWQVQFLKDLQEIVKLADLDILMATHSPDIIQDRWDLTVELQGMKK
jgi:predicted ATP-binding protein involved in virulence